MTTQWTFDLEPRDVFWHTTDTGWVTGHTHIAYGPLSLGATQVAFEGIPINPTAWQWYHRQIVGGRCPIVDTGDPHGQ